MASFNRVVLVGNLTKDIELRHTKNNTAVTDISIAVNERVKKNEQWADEVHFFDITLWGRLAEIAAEYLSKGSSVLIEGRLKHDRWEQDGQKRSKIGIVGEKMQMLGSKGGGSNSNYSAPSSGTSSSSSYQQPSQPVETPQDEVPF